MIDALARVNAASTRPPSSGTSSPPSSDSSDPPTRTSPGASRGYSRGIPIRVPPRRRTKTPTRAFRTRTRRRRRLRFARVGRCRPCRRARSRRAPRRSPRRRVNSRRWRRSRRRFASYPRASSPSACFLARQNPRDRSCRCFSSRRRPSPCSSPPRTSPSSPRNVSARKLQPRRRRGDSDRSSPSPPTREPAGGAARRNRLRNRLRTFRRRRWRWFACCTRGSGRVRLPRASRRHARVGGDRGETRTVLRVDPVPRRARFPTPGGAKGRHARDDGPRRRRLLGRGLGSRRGVECIFIRDQVQIRSGDE